jgi:dTDP-4-dehydrorhamnose reductase
LTDGNALRDAVCRARPTVVVNAAAYTAVDAAEADADGCRLVNALAPGAIAAAAEEVGAAVVHFSTDYVFDGALARPYAEDDTPSPLSVYGASKLEGERAVAAASTAYLTFRLSWVYGLRGRNFLRTMLRLARERDELRVVADQFGAPTWSRLAAAGVAQALGAAARSPHGLRAGVAEARGVYHLSASGVTSWHGFAEAILAADPAREEQRCRSVRAVPTTEYPTPAARPPYSVLSNDKVVARFGVRLPDWRDQLARMYRAR